jgi:hypothetical protein
MIGWGLHDRVCFSSQEKRAWIYSAMRACNGSSTPAISLNGMPSGERTLGLGQYRQVGLFRPFTRKADAGDKCVEDEGKDG